MGMSGWMFLLAHLSRCSVANWRNFFNDCIRLSLSWQLESFRPVHFSNFFNVVMSETQNFTRQRVVGSFILTLLQIFQRIYCLKNSPDHLRFDGVTVMRMCNCGWKVGRERQVEWMSIAFLFLHDPFPVSHCCSMPVSPAASPAVSLSSFSSSGRNTMSFPQCLVKYDSQLLRHSVPMISKVWGEGCVPRAP